MADGRSGASPAGAGDAPSTSLIKLTPSATLVFNLERGTQPKAILKVANTTNNKILFKVKTTQPTWYYVRPNQQILSAGQVEDVAILMVEAECNRFLDSVALGDVEALDKHRFLVQSRMIDEQDYDRIYSMPSAQRSDEFAKLWDGPKDDRKSVKLKVEFAYGADTFREGEARRGAKAPKPFSTVSENVESVRSRLGATESARDDSGVSTPEAIFAELQSLRKKYDAVVEYTVHLTGERDAIVSQLESAQRELAKEKAKKRGDSSSSNGKGDKNADKKIVEKVGRSSLQSHGPNSPSLSLPYLSPITSHSRAFHSSWCFSPH